MYSAGAVEWVKEVEVRPEQVLLPHKGLLGGMLEIGGRGEVINRATLFEQLGPSYMGQLDLGEMMAAVPSVRERELGSTNR